MQNAIDVSRSRRFGAHGRTMAETISISEQLVNALPPRTIEVLAALGEIASSRGESLFIVGGAVRDMLLGEAASAPDLDLVVEGDAVVFAFSAAERLGARCEPHKQFGTASIILPGDPEDRIDFATARTETYKRPGALPNVSPAKSIHDDLSRRDFTINAMAASLVPPRMGEVIDPHGGLEDLEARLIRVLHPGSFVDDPTRILRAFRFSARLGFGYEYDTERLMSAAIGEECFNTVSGARIRKEIRASLEEKGRAAIIKELNERDIPRVLAPGLCLSTELFYPEDRIAASMAALGAGPEPLKPQIWAAYLLAAVWGTDDESLGYFARRIALSKKEAAPLLNELASSPGKREMLSDPDLTDVEFEDMLAGIEAETLIVLHAADEEGSLRKRLERFVLESPQGQLEITGGDLLGMGHEPSPIFGQVLREVRRMKIEGKVNNRRQELAAARKLLNTWD